MVNIPFYHQQFALIKISRQGQEYYYTFAIKSLIHYQFLIGVNKKDKAYCLLNPNFDTLEVKDISRDEAVKGQYDWNTFTSRFCKANNRSGFIFRFQLDEKIKFKNSVALENPMKQGLRVASRDEAKRLEKEIVRTLATRKMKDPYLNLLLIEANGLLMTYTRMVRDGEIEEII